MLRSLISGLVGSAIIVSHMAVADIAYIGADAGVSQFDNNATSARVTAAWMNSTYGGLTFSAEQIQDAEFVDELSLSQSLKLSGWKLAYSYPLYVNERFIIQPKVGGFVSSIDIDRGNNVVHEKGNSALTYGVEVNFLLSEQIAISASFERVGELDYFGEFNQGYVGFKYLFGNSSSNDSVLATGSRNEEYQARRAAWYTQQEQHQEPKQATPSIEPFEPTTTETETVADAEQPINRDSGVDSDVDFEVALGRASPEQVDAEQAQTLEQEAIEEAIEDEVVADESDYDVETEQTSYDYQDTLTPHYTVQLAAFSSEANAERFSKKISDVDVLVRIQEENGLYKVFAGQFSNQSDAIDVKNDIDDTLAIVGFIKYVN